MASTNHSGAGPQPETDARDTVVPRQPVSQPVTGSDDPSEASDAAPVLEVVQAPAEPTGWSPTAWKRRG